ncbi:hypothetical protein U2F10_23915 [Leptothoe sp. EHU-05/26/07-4]
MRKTSDLRAIKNRITGENILNLLYKEFGTSDNSGEIEGTINQLNTLKGIVSNFEDTREALIYHYKKIYSSRKAILINLPFTLIIFGSFAFALFVYLFQSSIFELLGWIIQIDLIIKTNKDPSEVLFLYRLGTFLEYVVLPIVLIAQLLLIFKPLGRLKRGKNNRFKNTYKYREDISLFRRRYFLSIKIFFWVVGLQVLIGSIAGLTSNSGDFLSWLFSIYLIIYAGILLFLGILIAWFKLNVLKRREPISYIIALLIEIICLLENNVTGDDLKLRSFIAKRIDHIASVFQYDIPVSFPISNSYERFFFESEAQKIANGFRSLKVWLYIPMADTQDSLITRLSHNLKSMIEGDWNSLPKLDSVNEGVLGHVTRKQLAIRELKRYGNLFFRAAIPIVIVYLVNLTPVDLTSQTFDYLVAGAFVLSALVLLVELDPNLGDKLDLLGLWCVNQEATEL